MINENTFGKGKRKWKGFKETIDTDTGELIVSNVFETDGKQDIGWETVWLKNLLHTLHLLNERGAAVLSYFLEHRDYENKVLVSKEMIIRDTGISRSTVYRIIDRLIEGDVIKQLEIGFQVNPNIVFNSLEAKKKGISRLEVVLRYKGYKVKDKKKFSFEYFKET